VKKIIFIFCIVLLTACGKLTPNEGEPLKGEKEVIEMIKERIDYNETAENTVVLYKREGKSDKKVTVKGTGDLLTEQIFQSEVAYEILQLESADEAKGFLADEIAAYEQVEGLHYTIEFFEPYFFEEITILYDDLNMDQYRALKGNVITEAEEKRDFLYVIRDYVEKGYKFLD